MKLYRTRGTLIIGILYTILYNCIWLYWSWSKKHVFNFLYLHSNYYVMTFLKDNLPIQSISGSFEDIPFNPNQPLLIKFYLNSGEWHSQFNFLLLVSDIHTVQPLGNDVISSRLSPCKSAAREAYPETFIPHFRLSERFKFISNVTISPFNASMPVSIKWFEMQRVKQFLSILNLEYALDGCKSELARNPGSQRLQSL